MKSHSAGMKWVLFLLPVLAISAAGYRLYVAGQEEGHRNLATEASNVADPNHHWLPDLTGLPPVPENFDAAYTKQELDKVKGDHCPGLDGTLNAAATRHFRDYTIMENAQHVSLPLGLGETWAHVLGMVEKESSGMSATVADMRGHGKVGSSLAAWKNIYNNKGISQTSQTNFGLVQLSPDRLVVPFVGQANAQDKFILTNADESGEEGEHAVVANATSGNASSNTENSSILDMRLIWFYQDMAQGRYKVGEKRYKENDPEGKAARAIGSRAAVYYCGSDLMFNEGKEANGIDQLADAFQDIAYCSLGNHTMGYSKNTPEWQCFARWVTLCPALSLDIAARTPVKYFQTRGQKPLCTSKFENLIKEVDSLKSSKSADPEKDEED